MKGFRIFTLESPTPGEPRSGGDYRGKWSKQKIPQDEIEKASNEVLQDALKNGGPNSAAIKAELTKRKEKDASIKIPEPGPEKGVPAPKGSTGGGDTGATGGGDTGATGGTAAKEPEEDPFKEATEDQKKILEKLGKEFVSENKESIKKVFDNEDVFSIISGQEYESEEQLQTAIKESADMIREVEEIEEKLKNGVSIDGEGDSDLPNPPFDPENLDKETTNALRSFLDTPLGKLVNDFIETEPSEFPGGEDIKATLMMQLRDSALDYIDYQLDKKAGVGSSESDKRKREIEKRKREKEKIEKSKKKDDKNKETKKPARSQEELIKLSDEDLQAVIDKGGEEAEIAKKIMDDRKKPKKTEESYYSLVSTIQEINNVRTTGYKNLHTSIREVWNVNNST